MLKNLLYKSKKIYNKIVWLALNLAFFAQFAAALVFTANELAAGAFFFEGPVFMIWGFLIVQWAALRFAKSQGHRHGGQNGGNNFGGDRRPGRRF
ncbi:MAG: hypothetical protein LBH81_01335 [Rickettsiales bacterium]|jgi:hypothetical protein|nr:hypothetical protein [Rickettsiales bacterium]